jgi:acyl-CoA synthetase
MGGTTGDIGILDADGYLTITDRKSDIIIRGGENISALEVEDVLLTMPGHDLPALEDVRAHFGANGVARQKWPEYLHEVVEFPRTPGGKVQKFKVREHARSVTAEAIATTTV